MIKLDSSSNDFYFCETADWSTVVLAESTDEAANKGLKLAKDALGKNLMVSACMRVKKIEEKFEDSDSLIRIDKIFADIGMYKESRSMSEIVKNLNK
jgi:hypothetical protein|tara:strand:+ start:274 stop:564 length:291 start_codon:yes stop_codon:yes gene_type:complete